MTKPVILTGLRANNDLHIGNYFGGMLPIIDMAKLRSSDYQINMFIPDLHSFTTPIDHDQLYDTILSNARIYAAAGLPLDDPDIHLYRQSYIPAHSELTWILDCFTGMGEMGRMTQYKDKSKNYYTEQEARGQILERVNDVDSDIYDLYKDLENDETKERFVDVMSRSLAESVSKETVSVGLFNYPVLMAADILLYGAQYVPVGDDQTQHLEFTRDIAERMNKRFGELFVIPEPVAKQHEFFGLDQGLRIRDLIDPSKKMSKSDDTGRGVIFLGDDLDTAHKKVMSATTDSLASVNYDRQAQPGITNLLDILALLRGVPPEQVTEQYRGMERYGDFKQIVADEVDQFLADFQASLASVDDGQVLAKLAASEQTMSQQANQTLLSVQQAVGLRPRV